MTRREYNRPETIETYRIMLSSDESYAIRDSVLEAINDAREASDGDESVWTSAVRAGRS